jgi:hypothetical protein
MVDIEFESIVELKVQDLVSLIIECKSLAFEDALQYLYESKLYAALTDEGTKLWHLSTEKLFDMLKTEEETGKLIYPDFV